MWALHCVTRNARGLCGLDVGRREGGVEVQRHQVLDIGVDGLQLGTVLDGLCDRVDGRGQVGLVGNCLSMCVPRRQKGYHDVDALASALAHLRHHGCHQRALAQVDVQVVRKWDFNAAHFFFCKLNLNCKILIDCAHRSILSSNGP